MRITAAALRCGSQILPASYTNACLLPASILQVAPATDMLPRVMKLISEEWQEIWDCCADNKLRAIKPTVGGYKRKTSLSRHDCVLINRLRIGHTRLTHSYLLLSDDQPECGTCQCPLTVKHILIECVDLNHVRNKYFVSPQ